jgi:hypothetical protein
MVPETAPFVNRENEGNLGLMVAKNYDNLSVLALERTETIDPRQPEKLQVRRRIAIGMIGMAATDAPEFVASPVSPVPCAAEPAELRGLPGILPFQPYPLLLAISREPLRHRGVKPMGQPSIEPAWKLSTRAVSNIFQVLDHEHPDLRKIELLEFREDDGSHSLICVLPALSKRLDDPIGGSGDCLAVGSHPAVFVVGIEPKDAAFLARLRTGFFENEIDEEPASVPSQTDRVSNTETLAEKPVQMLRRSDGNGHFGCAGPDEIEGQIKRPFERPDLDEVAVESDSVATNAGFALPPAAAKDLFGLFGERLGEARRYSEAVASPMNGRKIRELGGEVPSLPEEIDEVLKPVMAESEERDERSNLPRIKIVQKYTTGPPHYPDFGLPVGFDHPPYPTILVRRNRT